MTDDPIFNFSKSNSSIINYFLNSSEFFDCVEPYNSHLSYPSNFDDVKAHIVGKFYFTYFPPLYISQNFQIHLFRAVKEISPNLDGTTRDLPYTSLR